MLCFKHLRSVISTLRLQGIRTINGTSVTTWSWSLLLITLLLCSACVVASKTMSDVVDPSVDDAPNDRAVSVVPTAATVAMPLFPPTACSSATSCLATTDAPNSSTPARAAPIVHAPLHLLRPLLLQLFSQAHFPCIVSLKCLRCQSLPRVLLEMMLLCGCFKFRRLVAEGDGLAQHGSNSLVLPHSSFSQCAGRKVQTGRVCVLGARHSSCLSAVMNGAAAKRPGKNPTGA